jgi:prevent-host-death family protein
VSVPKEKPNRTKTRDSETATWQLQAAKAQLSEVIRRAHANGPQVITKQGKEVVVFLVIEQYKRLTDRAKQPQSLLQFFAESPLAGAGLNLKRNT